MAKKASINSINKRETRSSFAAKSVSGQPVQLQDYYRNKEKKKEENIEKGKKLAQSAQESSKTRKKPQSKSTKAGLILPVHSILNQLKKALPKYKIQQNSAVLLTGVIEYLVAEILDLSGVAASELKKKRISPRSLLLAVENDNELQQLLNHVHISFGGVVPNIHPSLLKKAKAMPNLNSSGTPVVDKEGFHANVAQREE